MAEETTTPAVPAAVDPPKPQAPAAPTPPAADPPPREPSFLTDRLERDRRSTLKQLGFNTDKGIPAQKQIDEAAGKVEELRKSRKQERRAKEAAEAKAAELTAKLDALKKFADLEISNLTPEQQAKVKAAAGDDPAEQLKVLGLLRPTFAQPTAATVPPANGKTETPPPQKTAPVPATTAPDAAPPPAQPGTEVPLLEQWKQVNAIGDPNRQAVARVHFLLNNGEQLLDALRKT